MSDIIGASYIIHEEFFKLLLENNENVGWDDINDYSDNDDIVSVVTNNSYNGHTYIQSLLSSLEIPHNTYTDGDYECAPESTEIRFEIDKQIGFPKTKFIEYIDGYQYYADLDNILKNIEKENITDIKQFLENKRNELKSLIPIENANIPSKERLLFLSVKNTHKDAFQLLCDKNISFNYKDLETGMSTFDCLRQIDPESKKLKLELLTEGDTELRAALKKALLNEHQLSQSHNHTNDGLSL